MAAKTFKQVNNGYAMSTQLAYFDFMVMAILQEINFGLNVVNAIITFSRKFKPSE